MSQPTKQLEEIRDDLDQLRTDYGKLAEFADLLHESICKSIERQNKTTELCQLVNKMAGNAAEAINQTHDRINRIEDEQQRLKRIASGN